MPSYTFRCDDEECDAEVELLSTIANYKPLTKCPNCKKETLKRDYETDLPTGTVVKGNSEITVGQLADRNSAKFSEDYKLHLYKKHNSYLWEGGDDITTPKGQPPDKLPKPVKTRKPRQRRKKI